MRIVDEILAPAREQELICQTRIKQIDQLHRIVERFEKFRGNSAQMRNILDKLAQVEEQLNNSIDRLIDRRELALVYIEKLEGDEYTVIFRYYIMGQQWDKIAEEIYFSERSVYMLRKSALQKLEKLYQKGQEK